MALADRLAEFVVRRRRVVVAVMLVSTLLVGSGAGAVEQSTTMESFATDSDAVEKNSYVRENFSGEGNTTTALIAVNDSDGNVLSRESLLRTLRYQRDLRQNATLNATLVEDRPTVGVANAVARAAVALDARQQRHATESGTGVAARPRRDGNHSGNTTTTAGDAASGPLTLDEQIAQLESMSDREVERVVTRLLAPDSELPGHRLATRLLPRDYEPGSTTAEARLVVVTQRTERPIRTGAAVSEEVAEGQMAARAIAHDQSGPETYRAFGRGFLTQQERQAIDDSLAILGPLALLFVLGALAIAYRDLLDVLLGLVGVGVVLVWTFGVLGWLGIEFNQVMVAVPILLIGLSVDYALHVVMRYRERRSADDVEPATAMEESLSGVGVALALVTLTTAVGFLANVTSPVPDLQLFGLVVALGIGCTLLVFGVFLPAVKTEIEEQLARRGVQRRNSAFGTGGRFESVLRESVRLARYAPLAVLALALVVGLAGAYAGAGVEATYEEDLFMADDPPEWTERLPEPMEPGEYFLKDNRDYVYSQFQSPDKQVQLLLEGSVTDPGALEAVHSAETAAADANVTFTRAGEATVESPVTAMHRVAQRNESFNATLRRADTDGNGVPDRNLTAVYADFYATAPEVAGQYVHRTDDGYEALRLRVSVDGTADHAAIHEQMQDVATTVNDDEETNLTATATGQPIVAREISTGLARTVVESLAVTLVAVLALLAVVFRVREGSASLGAVTLVPVALTVAWLLGTMSLLGIQFTLVTALVGSIALGLGVDYAIHVSERFAHELTAVDPMTALERTVVGTGGALLSSAVTTAAGFGVLTFSLLPGLGQFGLVLAVGIIYAFLASVVVLPSLLVLWIRHGPAGATARVGSESTDAASDD